ncbi:MAG: hypothetical protein HY658_05905 [Actinobacteria bacterium]|nr:hypothetical protein [Actinomycetota bacterium]
MAWVPALKVLVALAGVYLLLPRLVLAPPRTARGALDRLLIDVIRVTALLIAVAHVLVPLQLFQWTGLLMAFGACAFWFKLRPAGWTLAGMQGRWEQATEALLYLSEAGSRDGNDRVKQKVRLWWRLVVLRRLRPRLPTSGTALAAGLLVPLLLVIAASLVIRLAYPLQNAAFVPSDNYVHLAWTKFLSLGDLFHDGIYPRGMHSVLAVTSTLMPVTSFELARFAGPLMNTFFVLLVYVMTLRATRHAGAALVAAAVVGILGIRPEVGLADYRQIGTLPQEFAVLMAVAGLFMAAEYVARPSRDRLIYVGLAAFSTSMSHPLAAGLVIVGAGAIGVTAAIRSGRAVKALRMWAFCAAGVVVGNLYVVFGLLFGNRIYGGVTDLNPVASEDTHRAAGSFSPMIDQSPLAMAALVGAVIGLAYGIHRLRRGHRDGGLAAALSAFLLLAIAVEWSGDAILHPWYAERWEELVVALIPLGIGLGLAPLAELWARRPPLTRAAAHVSVGVAMAAGLVVALPPTIPHPSILGVEYEASARALGRLMKETPRLTYTVVGPPEWFDRVLGSGYHLQLIDFADQLDLSQASDPGFHLPIGTRRIFVLDEKNPFVYRIYRTAGGVIGARYQDLEARGELMRTVDEWIRTYSRFHDGVSIYYEDDDIIIWQIKHWPSPKYAERYELVREQ